MEDQGHQAMWPQMIAALAAIDEALGLPDDGCNSTGRTLVEIKRLQVRVADLIQERNVLQKISARRAGALECVGLHADCTMDEAKALRNWLWPPLPARKDEDGTD